MLCRSVSKCYVGDCLQLSYCIKEKIYEIHIERLYSYTVCLNVLHILLRKGEIDSIICKARGVSRTGHLFFLFLLSFYNFFSFLSWQNCDPLKSCIEKGEDKKKTNTSKKQYSLILSFHCFSLLYLCSSFLSFSLSFFLSPFFFLFPTL